MNASYSDAHLQIDDAGITILDYYFPLASKKVIPWEKVRGARRFELTAITGKYRIWGMGLRPYWFNCDSERSKKSVGFVLDTGTIFKPAITPEQPEKLAEILRERGLLA